MSASGTKSQTTCDCYEYELEGLAAKGEAKEQEKVAVPVQVARPKKKQ